MNLYQVVEFYFQHVLVKFLLARDDSKRVILNVCRSMLSSESQATLSTISKVLDMLNRVYQDYLNSEIHVLVSVFSCLQITTSQDKSILGNWGFYFQQIFEDFQKKM